MNRNNNNISSDYLPLDEDIDIGFIKYIKKEDNINNNINQIKEEAIKNNNMVDKNIKTSKVYLLRKKRERDLIHQFNSDLNFGNSDSIYNKNKYNVNENINMDIEIDNNIKNLENNTINNIEKKELSNILKENNIKLANNKEGNCYIKINEYNLGYNKNSLFSKLESLGYEILEEYNNKYIEDELVYEDDLERDSAGLDESDLDGKSIDYSDDYIEEDINREEDVNNNYNYNENYINNKYMKKLNMIQKKMNEELNSNTQNKKLYSMDYYSDNENQEDDDFF